MQDCTGTRRLLATPYRYGLPLVCFPWATDNIASPDSRDASPFGNAINLTYLGHSHSRKIVYNVVSIVPVTATTVIFSLLEPDNDRPAVKV